MIRFLNNHLVILFVKFLEFTLEFDLAVGVFSWQGLIDDFPWDFSWRVTPMALSGLQNILSLKFGLLLLLGLKMFLLI